MDIVPTIPDLGNEYWRRERCAEIGDSFPPKDLPAPTRQKIWITHPNLPSLQAFLIFLPLDKIGDAFGVHYQMVMDACYIVANNQLGFLSTDQAGTELLQITAPDQLLQCGTYYYHVHNDDSTPAHTTQALPVPTWTASGSEQVPPPENPQRPACPQCTWKIHHSFSHWKFPQTSHLGLRSVPQHLDHWKLLPEASGGRYTATTDFRSSVESRDVTCIASGWSAMGCDACHLIPAVQYGWYTLNGIPILLNRDNAGSSPEDEHNGVLLRKDIHSVFDKLLCVFYPKGASYVLHFLHGIDPRNDYLMMYHNSPCRVRNPGVCLFAAFARAILGHAHNQTVHMPTQWLASPSIPPKARSPYGSRNTSTSGSKNTMASGSSGTSSKRQRPPSTLDTMEPVVESQELGSKQPMESIGDDSQRTLVETNGVEKFIEFLSKVYKNGREEDIMDFTIKHAGVSQLSGESVLKREIYDALHTLSALNLEMEKEFLRTFKRSPTCAIERDSHKLWSSGQSSVSTSDDQAKGQNDDLPNAIIP